MSNLAPAATAEPCVSEPAARSAPGPGVLNLMTAGRGSFCRGPEGFRRVQMLGALIWMAYGLVMRALPVVEANLLVLSAAAGTARRSRAAPEIADPAR